MDGLTIGAAFRLIREAAGEPLGMAAPVLGLHPAALRAIEEGRDAPAPDTLKEIRSMYGYCPLLLVAIDTLHRAQQESRRETAWTLTDHYRLLGLGPT